MLLLVLPLLTSGDLGLGLVILVLVLVLRIWSCLHHWVLVMV